jgi:hypothetical protein
MPDIQSETEALSATAGAAVANGLDTAAAVQAELADNHDARTQLRREADKVELRLALRDLADGFRGMIRVAPLLSVGAAVAFGLMFGRRRAPRRPSPPRRA